jgi:hypothetical protein
MYGFPAFQWREYMLLEWNIRHVARCFERMMVLDDSLL